MIWPRRSTHPTGRHRRHGDQRPAEDTSPTVTRSDETERALRAAARAQADLEAARTVRAKIDRLGDAIDSETSRNGFRVLIEHALGGKA